MTDLAPAAIARPRMPKRVTAPAVGDLVAAARARRMPCFADVHDRGCELLSVEIRGGDAFEVVRCPGCDRTWRRIWVGGYA